jgi:NAD(P)-dependent dehydrogenase (short-subunit alcohol dehydrogenase family)
MRGRARTCRSAAATRIVSPRLQRRSRRAALPAPSRRSTCATPRAWRNGSPRPDERAPLDLVIAKAGISGGTHGGPETPEQTRAIFAVNLDGVLNVVLPTVPRMAARGRGQIAIISSLAGYRGMPGAPAYSGSKAAVRVWGEGLRGDLLPQGVKVNVVMPGFIKSPMTYANRFPMPFLMSADKAAGIIQRGLAADRAASRSPSRPPSSPGSWARCRRRSWTRCCACCRRRTSGGA